MTPHTARRAAGLIWVSLGIAALTSVGSRLAGLIDSPRLYGELVIYTVLCILPYRLARGSSAARIMFIILTAIAFAWMFAGGYSVRNKLELVVDIPQAALTIYIVILLLRKPRNGVSP